MAQNRSHEIKQIKSDLAKLSRAAMLVGKMQGNNNNLITNLTELGNAYSASVRIPQEDFCAKMDALNEDIKPSLCSIEGKISRHVEHLNSKLKKYEDEQRQWEAEQQASNTDTTN
jgi:hypothetical protein